MQRSSPLMAGHLRGVVGNWRDFRRCLAARSGWGNSHQGGGAYRGGSGAGKSGGGSDKPESPAKGAVKSAPRASATSKVMSDASYYARGHNTGALERRINREDNMWHDRSHIDTKWLNPRDPLAYRPNFRQTEPTMLRRQFMRSPDEVSREVLGRDWEEAVKAYRRSAMGAIVDGSRKSGWEKDSTQKQKPKQQQQQQQHTQQHSQQQQQQQQQPQHSQFQHWGLKPPQDRS